jgi:hypothetical protein
MANGDPTQGKKGLPALAWIGIGCGVIILIGAIALVAGGVFVAKKVKDVAGDFEKNPALASARMIVKVNPEWEEVSTDDKAGTITVREKKTGKEMTIGLDDLAKGRVTLSSEGKSYTLEAQGDKDTGQLKVTDGSGKTVFSAGGAGGTKPPEWVPTYPGTSAEGGLVMQNGTSVSGSFQAATDDAPDKVVDYYRKTLGDAGFKVRVNTYSEDNAPSGGVVYGENEAAKRTVTVMVSVEDGRTTAAVSYSQGE